MERDHFRVHCDRALSLLALERYEQACVEVREALLLVPESGWALSLFSECLGAMGHFRKAELVARRAVDCEPDNLMGHMTLLNALCCQGELGREAVECVERMLEMFPNEVGAFVSASNAQYNLHWYEDALRSANLGLEINPNHIRCLRCRSLALFKLFRFREAKECLQQILAIDPENALAYSDLGWEEYNAGHLKEAEEFLLRALRICPEFAWALRGLKFVRNLL